MKKLFRFLLVLLIIGGVAVLTCPDKQGHKDAIMNLVNETISEELGANNERNADAMGLISGIASIGSHVSGWVLDSNLTVENHFVFSLGRIKHGNEDDIVSVGVFGHVFTGKKEDVKKWVTGN